MPDLLKYRIRCAERGECLVIQFFLTSDGITDGLSWRSYKFPMEIAG
jgi:hypothetical protein